MNWLKQMNDAIDYVEAHIMEDIDMKKVAEKACCSVYNFQRIFSFMTDMSITEYIRKRRLTLVAFDIRRKGRKIIDVAMDYGYTSPVSFARAFQAHHGISPSRARIDGVELRAYPRTSFQLSIKGGYEMIYRIETKEAFKIFGLESKLHFDGHPAEFWQTCHQNGSYETLYQAVGEQNNELCRIHAVMNYDPHLDNQYAYMLFGFVNDNSLTKDYKLLEIPEQTYAIFPSRRFSWDEDFHLILSQLQKQFYTEWLPTSNYQKMDGPEFEIYGGDTTSGYLELWYPIKKANE